MPHIATMGRDEILQQTPLKHPQIAPNTHGKVLRPIMTTQINKAYLYWIENRAI
ncbi:cag pathogenicity island protein [Helicobacter pylori]|uniref:cag pathogenicity island protein n=1 Tax=Helicobacter pylori TaxID=210 RepID=UPI0012B32CFB|nr:cag pathogenicity island protein [Helicobacter pylori]